MKKITFSYKNTRLGIIATTLMLITTLALIVVFLINPNKPVPAVAGGLAYPATLPAIANGCGDIYRIPPKEGNFGVIPAKFWELNKNNNNINIPTTTNIVVPIFGYMGEEGLAPGDIRFYEPDEVKNTVDRTKMFRSMYDDELLVIWYTTDMAPADINSLRGYAKENPGKVLVHPWNNGGKTMIQGREVAYSKWATSQTCAIHHPDVLGLFLDFVDENPIERETPIPEAPMTKKGMLLPIDTSDGSN